MRQSPTRFCISSGWFESPEDAEPFDEKSFTIVSDGSDGPSSDCERLSAPLWDAAERCYSCGDVKEAPLLCEQTAVVLKQYERVEGLLLWAHVSTAPLRHQSAQSARATSGAMKLADA